MADLGDGGDDERTLAALDAAIVPGTRLVSISHVAWTTGAVLPIARIAELAHARGALLAVDGAQAIGAIPVDVGALGTDFYAMPAQKWLLGPEGMAALHVAAPVLDRARQTFAGHFSYASHDLTGGGQPWPDGRRFETSGYGRAAVMGMARSIAWLSMYVGLDWVHRRGTGLARQAADRLAAIPRSRARHAARADGDPGDVPASRPGRRPTRSRRSPVGRSRSSGRFRPMRSGSASGSTTARRSSSGSPRRSSSSQATRRGRCRRAGP